MDKSTLSNYGWVVIAVLVLSVMIALATPFGTYIGNAVKSTTEGLFQVEQKALGAAGLVVDDQNFAEVGNENLDTPVVSFGETYCGINNIAGICEFTFYENGSAKMKIYVFNVTGGETAFADDILPEGALHYKGTEIIDTSTGESILTLSSDGSILYYTAYGQTEENGVITDTWSETSELTIQEKSTLPIKVNELYTANNGGASIAFTEDGTAYWYNNYSLVWTWQYKIIGTQVVTPIVFDIADNGNALKVYEDGAWQTFYLEPGKMDEIS